MMNLTSIQLRLTVMIAGLLIITMTVIMIITRYNFEAEMRQRYHDLTRSTLESVMRLLDEEYEDIVAYEQDMVIKHRKLMEVMTSSALAVIRSQYLRFAADEISENDARAASLAWVKTLCYGENQYVFVCDMKLNGLCHPIPQMEGRSWAGFQDIRFTDVFRHVQHVIMDRPGVNAVFRWPAIDDLALIPQMGYFRYFPEWEWIVGTTVPIELLKTKVLPRHQHMINKLTQVFQKMDLAQIGHLFVLDGSGQAIITSGSSVHIHEIASKLRQFMGADRTKLSENIKKLSVEGGGLHALHRLL